MDENQIDKDWSRFLAKRVTNELAYLLNKYKLKSDCLDKFPEQAYYALTKGFYIKLYDKKRYIEILESWFRYYCTM